MISLPGETCKVLIIGMISDSRTGFHNQITCDMSHVSVGVCVRDEKCLCNNEKKMAMKTSYRFFHFLHLLLLTQRPKGKKHFNLSWLWICLDSPVRDAVIACVLSMSSLQRGSVRAAVHVCRESGGARTEPICLSFTFGEKGTQTETPVITRRGPLRSAQHPHRHNGFQLLVKIGEP